jgi:hypothetical protein
VLVAHERRTAHESDARMDLTDRETEILRFERERWRSREAKDSVVAHLFDLTPVRYAQALNPLLRRPEALDAEPEVVRRLLRLRLQGKSALPPVLDPRHRRQARPTNH